MALAAAVLVALVPGYAPVASRVGASSVRHPMSVTASPVTMLGNLGDSLKKAQDMMKNISPEKLKKAQEMSMKMQDLQKELAATEIECKSADGKITVLYTGQSVPLSVKVEPEAMSSSADELSESLSNALKQAFINSRKHADSRMMELYEEAGLGDLIRAQQAAAAQQSSG
eukprot:CAMPEP_0119413934 /NCGR_PEP_ID=MMETSP1335-20130426/6248_1 /TAXON_ID=259385 /ORGANISM="Chrysoculter rhomboideus, Strain RCC1486" /LENGTH=170 /DNA_ID=CAMNT_0007438767 /DNA_START=26 /DNA_END=538 /DNA_ORIENTATION=+